MLLLHYHYLCRRRHSQSRENGNNGRGSKENEAIEASGVEKCIT